MTSLNTDIPALDKTILEILAEQTTPEVIPELIEAYLEDTAQRVTLIQEAATNGNIVQIGHHAHALKSSSGAYGAMQVCAIAKAIEHACKAGKNAQALSLAAQLPELAQRSIPALREIAEQYAGRTTVS